MNTPIDDVTRIHYRKCKCPCDLDESGTAPLHLATVLSKIPKIVALLLDKGADTNSRNEDNTTSLLAATAFNDMPEMTALLLNEKKSTPRELLQQLLDPPYLSRYQITLESKRFEKGQIRTITKDC